MPRIEHPSSSALAEVVRVRPFRRLWLVFGLSSLGDWLGLLGTSSFASAQLHSPAAQGVTFGGVIAVQLLPSLVLGPLAGVVADRVDRRHIMVTVDVARFMLFASIPLAGRLLDARGLIIGWAATASFLAQAGAMVWTPAKEAAVPNLLPRARLETANQLGIITTYGVTPILAALAFAGATALPGVGRTDAIALALYFDALTFLACAGVVFFGVREISGRGRGAASERVRDALSAGWHYLVGSPLMRGLIVGLLGAFAGAGIVVGAAEFYARSLGGGDATFGLLFGGLFAGFALGVVAGPTVVGRLSRRRTFALSVLLAGVGVVLLALMPRLGGALVVVVVVGGGAGMAMLSGVTLLGAEVADDVRGRAFAFVQTSARVVLLLSIAVASTLASAGSGRVFAVAGSRVLLAAAGLCGIAVGFVALHLMDDRRDVPLGKDVWAALTRRPGR